MSKDTGMYERDGPTISPAALNQCHYDPTTWSIKVQIIIVGVNKQVSTNKGIIKQATVITGVIKPQETRND